MYMDSIEIRFGYRVRRLRQALHISQEKFALQIEMDRTYLASVEAGRRNISIRNIEKIANGLHISLAELFSDSIFNEQRDEPDV